MATVAEVTDAYFKILGRPPDPEGLAYYTTGEGAARGIDQIRKDFDYAVGLGAEQPALVTQSDVNTFNNLVASGNFTQAAQFAAAKGVDPAITADYINQNAANLGLPADFRVNAANVTPTAVAAAQAQAGVPATGPTAQAALDYYKQTGDIIGTQQRLAESAGMPNITKEQAAANVVENIYQKNLDRAPDPSGLKNYTDKLLAGVSYDDVLNEIQNSPEAKAKAGTTTTTIQKKGLDAPALNRSEILELYRSIGMASPKEEDINFWLDYSQNNPDVINSANPRNQVINAFKAAAQSYGLPVSGDFGEFGRSGARPTITSPILPEGKVLSPLQFATPQRGIGALRGPAYMPSLLAMPEGATNMTSPFGGSGIGAKGIKAAADEFLRAEMAAGKVSGPNDPKFATLIANFMDQMNVSPAEYAAAFGSSRGAVQSLYDAVKPQGIFATPQPVRRQGPFALETGVSFGPLAVSPEAIAREEAAAVKAATDAANAKLNPAGNAASLLNYEGGDSGGPSGPVGPGMSASDLGNAIALGLDAFGLSALGSLGLNSPEDAAPVSGISEAGIAGVAGDGGAGASGAATGDSGGVTSGEGIRTGGLIRYQAGGMPKLSAKEAGSRFDVSEYIDPKTGRFYINEYQRDVVFNPELREAERVERERISRMAKGGLASIAENLAEKGRGGDTMLVHMSPEEVQGINALTQRMTGRSLTINPNTGLPEAFLAAFLPALLGFAGTKVLGLTALKSAMLVGAGYALKYKSLKRGLSAGLGAFGGAQLGAGLEAAAAGAPSGTGINTNAASTPGLKLAPSAGGVTVPTGLEVVTPNVGAPLSTGINTALDQGINLSKSTFGASGISGTGVPLYPSVTGIPTPEVASSMVTPKVELVPGVLDTPTLPPSTIGRMTAGAENLMSSDEATRKAAQAAYKGATDSTPFMAASQVLGGASMDSAVKEQDAFKAAQAARDREEEERRRQYAEIFSRTLGRIPVAAGGGLVALAQGGMPTFEYGGTTAPTGEPRMVKGAGDGMSDNVPANIEGVQEARLANDEFVVPADVVADIGNGSSSAGAKKLYAMMDRIRKARHGTTEQPPEIEAERLMPA